MIYTDEWSAILKTVTMINMITKEWKEITPLLPVPMVNFVVNQMVYNRSGVFRKFGNINTEKRKNRIEIAYGSKQTCNGKFAINQKR